MTIQRQVLDYVMDGHSQDTKWKSQGSLPRKTDWEYDCMESADRR